MDWHGPLPSAFVFLAAAVIVVPLARRVGLGSVLGYLLAGVAIGPFGLALVADPEAVLHFAEFGVVMMLFLIGLELKPTTLWRLRQRILGMGGAQVSVTIAALVAAGHLLGLSWTEALVVGMALSLSSTAIALQILNERGLMPTRIGESGFAVLLFQDVAVIPMLAVLPLLGGGTLNGGEPDWLQAALMIGAVAAIPLAGHYLLRPLFRIVALSGVREIFTALSLLLVVGIALLMQAIGLSAALGTFLAGVVLAESEYRHALETDIEPFKGLLLGLFFMSVGMSVDFALVAEEPTSILALTAGLLAIKLVIFYLLGRAFRLPGDGSRLFALILAQGGEFAFVVFQFATTEGTIPAAVADRFIVVVALSMAMTPLLLVAHDHIAARLRARATAAPSHDAIESGEAPVIIFGFGRFGQVIGRLLDAAGIETTVLDNDPDHIEVLRRFGHKVFYGDASRLDLIEAAGAKEARLFIIAIDDTDKTVEVARLLRERFPDTTILARARNRNHVFELMNVGVDAFRRETFDSALALGRQALVELGLHPTEARRTALAFAGHDEEYLLEAYALRGDEQSLISLARQSRADLEDLLRNERSEREAVRDAEWGV